MNERFTDNLRPRRTDDGILVDQYDRDADGCAASAAAARALAESMHEAARLIRHGAVVLGRLGGDRQVRRLDAAAELFECVAERDEAFGCDLEKARAPRSEAM